MTSWKLAGNSAQWADGSAVLSFDQTAPGNGLSVFTPPVLTEPALQLFGTWLHDDDRSGPGPAATRVCAASIHATFAEKHHLHVETQVRWRVNRADVGYTSIDVVVSVGTQALSAFAAFGLGSLVKSSDILVPKNSALDRSQDWIHVDSVGDVATTQGTPCTLFRLPGTGLSYVEMLHPSDLGSHEVSRDPDTGRAVIRHQLFSCPLEKGVILRARLRGALLPRDSDQAAAAAMFAQFATSDPPLGR
jgi:hypothetical protein